MTHGIIDEKSGIVILLRMHSYVFILVLAVLTTSIFQVQAWVDDAAFNGPRPVEEHLTLKDGSMYFGKLTGFDPVQGILWKHPNIVPDLRVDQNQVKYIQLGNLPASKKTTKNSWQVTLVNGDVLSGDIKKISDGKLKLDTWFGGELQLKQSSLKILEPRIKPAKYIFQGPQSVRDWHFYDPSISQTVHPLPANATAIEIEEKIDKINSGDGWKLTKNQTFETATGHSHVGRFFEKLPDRICYDFEIQWKGNSFLQVNFLTDKLNPFNHFGNGYSLRFKPDTVSLYRHINGNRDGNRVNSTDLVGSDVSINRNTLGNRARLSIRVDREKKSIALFINDKFIKHWDDAQSDPLPVKSNGLSFTAWTKYFTLSRINLKEWPGNTLGGNNGTEQQGDQDFVLLDNGDRLSCKLIDISAGIMTFETPLAKLPIPLKNIERVYFAKNTPEPLSARTVRAVIRNGGSISGELVKWNDGKISLKSPFFGEVSFVDSIFQSIEFVGKPTQTWR